MWKQSYTEVFDNVAKEDIWVIWRDVSNWHQWNADIQYCKLNGPFLSGSHLSIKPKFGPSIKVNLITVEKNKSFTQCMFFLGGKMYTTYEMSEDQKGLRLTTTVEVIGSLAFLWRKFVAKKMTNALPQQTKALVGLCKIQTENIKHKVNFANRTVISSSQNIEKDAFSFENPHSNPGFLLWQSSITWQHNIKKGLEPHNISHTQFAILMITVWSEKNKRQLTQAEICSQSRLDKVTISKSLKDLETKGYIRKLDNIRDSRTKLVKLTTMGKVLAENLVQSSKNIDTAFFKEVQRDESLFINMMRKLNSTSNLVLQK